MWETFLGWSKIFHVMTIITSNAIDHIVKLKQNCYLIVARKCYENLKKERKIQWKQSINLEENNAFPSTLNPEKN